LPFSKQDTFAGSISIREFNTGSLQSAANCVDGLVRNQSSFFLKIDHRRQAQFGRVCEL
jgi:hypothetical protein